MKGQPIAHGAIVRKAIEVRGVCEESKVGLGALLGL